MPVDEVALSYWCGKNVLLDPKDRIRLFQTNSITERMFLISKSLDYVRNNDQSSGIILKTGFKYSYTFVPILF